MFPSPEDSKATSGQLTVPVRDEGLKPKITGAKTRRRPTPAAIAARDFSAHWGKAELVRRFAERTLLASALRPGERRRAIAKIAGVVKSAGYWGRMPRAVAD